MLRTLASTLVVSALAVSPLSAADWATSMFQTTSHDFGTVAAYAKAEYEFVFTNTYLEDVHVASAVPSCSCTSVFIRQPEGGVKTYDKGAIVARFNTDRFVGHRGATITVTFDKPFYATVQLNVRGTILGDLAFNPGSVDLGNVDQGTAVTRDVSVQYTGGGNLRILGATSANPHLSAEVVPVSQGVGQALYYLRVHLSKDAPPGYLKDSILLTTSDPYRGQIPVTVEGRVVSEVTVSPSSLFLGVVPQGQKVVRTIVVRGKQPFRIISATADGPGVEFNLAGADQPKELHVIPVTFTAGKESGRIVRTIRIQTDLSQKAAELVSHAVVQARETLALRPDAH